MEKQLQVTFLYKFHLGQLRCEETTRLGMTKSTPVDLLELTPRSNDIACEESLDVLAVVERLDKLGFVYALGDVACGKALGKQGQTKKKSRNYFR